MSGRFALNRGWRDNALFRNEPFTKACAWVWMIERACYKPVKFDINGQVVTLQRSQFCSSIRQLADEWGWSKSAVDRFMTRLKTETMIETDVGTGKLIVTICNYDKHQPKNEYSGTPSGTASGTGAGQERDTKEKGNKGIRDIEPNGPISERADAPIPAKPKKRSSAWVSIERPESVSNDVWAEFELHRKRKGAAITDTVMRAFEREAGKLGWSLEAAIIKSIERNWQGFEASWIRKENGNGNYHNEPDAGTNDPVVQAIIAGKAERAGQQRRQYGDDAGGWPQDGGDPPRFL